MSAQRNTRVVEHTRQVEMLWFNNELWAIIVERDEATPLTLEVFGRRDGQPWAFVLDDA